MTDDDEVDVVKAIIKFVLVIAAIIIIVGAVWSYGPIAIVPAGHVGVLDTFGSVDPNTFAPGIHLKWPWTAVIPISTQTQKYLDPDTPSQPDVAQISAITTDGLTVTVEIAANYHIDPMAAPELYKTVGTDYQNVVMKPPIHSVPRDIISQYDVNTLYSANGNATNRAKLEQLFFNGISNGLLKNGQSRGIVLEAVYLRAIDLPDTLKSAILSKMSMEQQIAQKQFEVEVAQKEAERKVAEAQGIANANKIIAGSLSEQYLTWYTIEMMNGHTGATYFIPIGSDGRVHPDVVLPLSPVTSVNKTA